MNTNAANTDPIVEAVNGWEAAMDDLHAVHFAVSGFSAYRHGFNSPKVTAASIEVETALRQVRQELEDAGSLLVGI